MKKRSFGFGKKKGQFLKIFIICILVIIAFFLGYLLGKPIMDIFR